MHSRLHIPGLNIRFLLSIMHIIEPVTYCSPFKNNDVSLWNLHNTTTMYLKRVGEFH